jgi:hypothetical protein
MDGLALAAALRTLPALKHLKLVAVTGNMRRKPTAWPRLLSGLTIIWQNLLPGGIHLKPRVHCDNARLREKRRRINLW